MNTHPAVDNDTREGRSHWLDAERLRVYPRIVIGVYATVVVAYGLSLQEGMDFRGQVLGADFVTFYSASTLALSGQGASAWNFELLLPVQKALFPGYSGFGFPWFYPPTFLLIVAPLALLPYLGALATFVGSSAAACVFTLRRAIGRPGAGWLIAAFPGLWVCAMQGQNGMLTAALAGGSILALRRHPTLSGVLLGMLIIKPHLAVLFAVALVAVRAWRTMLVAAATALAFLGASVAVFGPGSLVAWFDSLGMARMATESGYLPWAKMPSTFGTFRLLGASVEWSYGVHALVALAAAAGVWLVWRRSDSLQLRGAVLMTGTFLANPYAFDYDLVWLAFPIAWLALYGLQHGWRRGDRTILVIAWLLPAGAPALATLSHLQLAPLALMALIWLAVRPVVHVRLPASLVRLSQASWLSGGSRPGRQRRG